MRMDNFVILVSIIFNCVWSGASSGNSPFFRKGYEYSSQEQSFYKLLPLEVSWTEANRRCGREGATLAVPETRAEAKLITRLLEANVPGADAVYVGLQDILSEGVYTTVNGVPIAEVYNQWMAGEPSHQEEYHCVVLTKESSLRTANCDDKIPFVCKKTLTSLVWNPDCNLPDQGYIFNETTNKCYKFHLTPETWTEAFKVCAAEESYLAIINSPAEADVLVNIIDKSPKDSVKGNYLRGAVYLGFHNQFGTGFQTIFGETLEEAGYSWSNGQPDNSGGNELCGSMFYTGELNDISCNAWNCFYICEHDLGNQGANLDERFDNYIDRR